VARGDEIGGIAFARNGRGRWRDGEGGAGRPSRGETIHRARADCVVAALLAETAAYRALPGGSRKRCTNTRSSQRSNLRQTPARFRRARRERGAG